MTYLFLYQLMLYMLSNNMIERDSAPGFMLDVSSSFQCFLDGIMGIGSVIGVDKETLQHAVADEEWQTRFYQNFQYNQNLYTKHLDEIFQFMSQLSEEEYLSFMKRTFDPDDFNFFGNSE